MTTQENFCQHAPLSQDTRQALTTEQLENIIGAGQRGSTLLSGLASGLEFCCSPTSSEASSVFSEHINTYIKTRQENQIVGRTKDHRPIYHGSSSQ